MALFAFEPLEKRGSCALRRWFSRWFRRFYSGGGGPWGSGSGWFAGFAWLAGLGWLTGLYS